MVLLIVIVSIGLSLAMAAGWAFQRARKNGGWTDVFWSFALGIAGVVYALWPLSGAPNLRQWMVAAMVAAWSIRLGSHIAIRTAKGPEDARYAHFRKDWGKAFDAKMFGFLQVQALAAALLAIAMLAAARNPAPGLRAADIAGVLILLVAVGGEGLADAELSRFKADKANKGKINDRGLWAWSRHPNYFFEWLGWFAYAAIAVDFGGGYPFGWAALAGPIFMFVLLRYVSGVPPLEERMAESRGKAFDAYKARTSPFFLLPPRKG